MRHYQRYSSASCFCLTCLRFGCERLAGQKKRHPYLNRTEVCIARLLATTAPRNRALGEALSLTEGTVKEYLCRMSRRIRVAGFKITDGRVGLAAWALAHLPADATLGASAETAVVMLE